MPSYPLVFSRTAFHSKWNAVLDRAPHTGSGPGRPEDVITQPRSHQAGPKPSEQTLYPFIPGLSRRQGLCRLAKERSCWFHQQEGYQELHDPPDCFSELRPPSFASAVLPNSILSTYVSCLVAKKNANSQQQWFTTPACEGVLCWDLWQASGTNMLRPHPE